MKKALKWITDALASKDITHAMAHFKIDNGTIQATNGRLIACHPWPDPGTFVVPGDEFEKLFARMPDEPTITVKDNAVQIRSGRYHGTINTLSKDKWAQPGVEDAQWLPLPPTLTTVLAALRPFVSDNAMHPWADCVALEKNWAFATNNVALAGAPCKGLGPVMALLPSWAVDFVLRRIDGLSLWAWTSNYVAFKWDNGAWMRSTLVVGQFPERAAEMVRDSVKEKPRQAISEDFRKAFNNVAFMAEDTVEIYADHIVARFKQAEMSVDLDSITPQDAECSIWGAAYLIPTINAATHWDPGVWPKPAPFKGPIVSGYVVGRKA